MKKEIITGIIGLMALIGGFYFAQPKELIQPKEIKLGGVGIVDSYSESNANQLFSADDMDGQSFDSGAGGILDSAKFFLANGAENPGTVVAKVFTHSGTYGTNSVGTGVALATSDSVDLGTLSTGDPALVTFNFSGANRITLSANTKYVVVFDASAGITYKADNTSPTHSGNATLFSTSWSSDNTIDNVFYVYGEPLPPTSNSITSDLIIFE